MPKILLEEGYMLDFLRHMRHKKQFIPLILAVAAVFIFSGMWFFSVKTPAYAIIIDGHNKFAVKERTVADKALKDINSELNKDLGKEKMAFANKVQIKRTMVSRKDIIPADHVLDALRQEVKFKFNAVAIMVNGKTVTYVASKDIADEVLGKIKQQYSQVDQGEKLISAQWKEKVELKNQKVAAGQIKTAQQAFELITTGSENPEKYEVKEGDSLWLIARRNDMYVDDIKKANHLESEDLKPGDKLTLIKSQPYINVIAQVEGEKIEVIPFETKIVNDSSAPRSVKVKQEGQTGEKKVAYTATKCNGVISQKTVLQEKIIKAAVDKIIVKGSRVTYVASRGGGTGSLDWPVHGSITQYFTGGHTGVDIAARSGTAIRAADGGKVTFAGTNGGYGRFIIINHGNGLVTRYAHCSSLSVSAGDSVSKGQVIGAVGSTGHSTGPHLHFEVLSGGSFRNPFSYLR
jgi:murein DD-endopeptidase MepM/ murein hydrolase activator NlpD